MDEAWGHLNVDEEVDTGLIADLISMVEDCVAIEIGEDLADLEDANGRLPPRLRHSMLLLLGHFYNNREAIVIGVSVTKLLLGYEYLLAPFKNYTIK